MKKVGIVGRLGSGSVNPILALARSLVIEGAQVFVALPKRYSDQIDAVGAVHTAVYPPPSGGLPSGPNLLEEAKIVLPQLFEAWSGENLDIVASHFFSVAGQLFAAAEGILDVRLWTTYARSSEVKLPKELRAFARTLEDFDRGAWSLIGHSDGLPLFLQPGDLNVCFLGRWIHENDGDFDETFLFCSPGYRTGTPVPNTGSRTRPHIFMSLGTEDVEYRPGFRIDCIKWAIAAVRNRETYLTISCGGRVNVNSFGALPENVTVREFVDQVEVLQSADLFITHGGMNSVMESISNGVPMICVPQMLEQSATARRLQELGLGTCLAPEDANPLTLRETIDRVLMDAQMRQHVREKQEDIARSFSLGDVANLILSNTMRHRSKVLVSNTRNILS